MIRKVTSHSIYAGSLASVAISTVSTMVKHERSVGQHYIPVLSAVASFSHYTGILGLGIAGGLFLGAKSSKERAQAGLLGVISGVSLWQGRHQISRLVKRGQNEHNNIGKHHTRKLRLFAHNVLMTNRDNGEGIGSEIAKLSPDVVFLVETNAQVLSGMENALSQYPYRWEISLGESEEDGGVLVSRFLIHDVEILEEGGRPCVSVLLRVPLNDIDEEESYTDVRFIGVHTVPPLSREWGRKWVKQLNYIREYTINRLASGENIIMAGDFNATISHAPFRRLLKETGMLDISYGIPTWPKPFAKSGWRNKVKPLLALDHVLIGGQNLQVSWLNLGEGVGSDHAPIVCDLTII